MAEELETIKGLAAKLQALADPSRGGTPAEVEVAARKLKTLLDRHNLTEADLYVEAVAMFRWDCFSQDEVLLLKQVAFYILEVKSITISTFKRKGWGMSKGKTIIELEIEMTRVQQIDVDACFKHYRVILADRLAEIAQQLEALKLVKKKVCMALVHKYNLHGPDLSDDDGKQGKGHSLRELTAIMAAMRGFDASAKWEKPSGNVGDGVFRLVG
jgi:hypothetical protein